MVNEPQDCSCHGKVMLKLMFGDDVAWFQPAKDWNLWLCPLSATMVGYHWGTHCAGRCGAAAHCCAVPLTAPATELTATSHDAADSFFVISIPSGSWSVGAIGRFELSNFASLANDCVTCWKHVRVIVTVVSWRQNTHTQRVWAHCSVMRWGAGGKECAGLQTLWKASTWMAEKEKEGQQCDL